MNTLRIASLAAAGLMTAPFAAAQDSAAGESVYQSVCKNCHGPTAKGMASFPKLIGQGPEYLSERLTAYRAKQPVGPNSALMYPIAGKLSDADIENVVAYITTELE
ncbi:c-type cytochrome [Alloyangia pacifica]|uniref:Cytochrome c553 n=1 Tax=Alloyangia pacifica TaxID=311180 RepID=A0A1I6W988_9RHOB|nr:c-type cytochrome [Alloyangia pacifica]SDI43266.1 Cytochrome c553 [Alloyangia pacifica]SFT22114.1 Cytochrome c553 [Alloyangia pacifica]